MAEVKVLLKKTCSYAQVKNLVYVKQLLLVAENGEKRLALRLVNERAERVSSVTVAVELFDDSGNSICVKNVKLDVPQASGIPNEPFVPERKITVPERTRDVVVKVISADYGNYTYRTDGSAVKIEYNCGENDLNDTAYEDKSKYAAYAAKAGKSGITVTRKKYKAPVLVVIAMFIALSVAVGAICIHLFNFIKAEKTFLYSGVEYAFENDDRSDGSNIYVVGYHGSKSRIVIPKQIEGHTVTQIADGAFKDNKALTSISFSSDIPIGVEAFKNCINLRTVDFEHITEIGRGAFFGCKRLSSVTITPAISVIPREAFAECRSLSSVIVKESDEPIKIGGMAFSYCEDLKNVDFARRIDYGYAGGEHNWFVSSRVDRLHLFNFDVTIKDNYVKSLFGIPLGVSATAEIGELIIDSMDSIPAYFCKGSTVTSLTVKKIGKPAVGNNAFESCTALSSFDIGTAVTEAGDYAFYNTALTEFDGNALEKIGVCSFASNKKLASFELSQNTVLTSIGSGAFKNCTALTSVTLPFGVIEIAQDMFSGCSALAEIEFAQGSSVLRIFSGAFSGCSALTQFALPTNSLEYIGAGAFRNCTSLKKFDITEKVAAIDDEAFAGCKSFTDFVIPKSVTAVGNGVLSGCSLLQSLTVPFVGGKVDADGYLPYTFGARRSGELGSKYVPKSLKKITVTDATNLGNYAFFGCSDIITVNLSDGIKSIGVSAFSGCKSLKSIDIPYGVSSIGVMAFYDCIFTELTIPDSVTEIGRNAFGRCDALTALTVPFVGNTMSENGYLAYTFVSDDYYYSIPSSLKTVTVTKATELAKDAFYYAGGLEKINLPDTLEKIGEDAFYNCFSLKSLVIPNSVVSIGKSAFIGCNALEELSMPFVGARRATEINDNGSEYSVSYAFGGSWQMPRSLKKITITDSDYLVYNAFSDGKYIEQIVIDCPLDGISWTAFNGCYRLLEIFNYSGVEIVNDTPEIDKIAASVLKIYTDRNEAPLTRITTTDGYRCIRDDDNNWYMIDYIGGRADIELPSSVSADGYSFSKYSVWQYLFYQDDDIASVTIPAAVTEVGEYAFSGCYTLEHVLFAENSSVTNIRKGTFMSCHMLYDLSLPKNLEQIEEFAFAYCRRLKKFYVAATLSDGSIADYAFAGCERLFEIYNFSSINIVKGSADNGRIAENARAVHTTVLEALDSVTVNGVQYIKLCENGIDWWAVDYYGDGSLEIKPFTYKGEKIASIGIFSAAFRNDDGITSVVISNAVSRIDSYVFSGCYNISSITLSDDGGVNSEMEIQDNAFGNCGGLTEFKSEVAISSIGETAFANNYRLRKVEFLKDVASICENAFSGAPLVSATFSNVGTVSENAFNGCENLETVVFGNVGTLGESAFAANISLSSVSFGDVGEIGTNAFLGCTALKSVSFAGNVNGIGDKAFDGDPITSLIFGGNVGSIGERAFRSGKLSSLTFNGNVGSIGEYAFAYNYRLASLEFKGTLNSVGPHAFQGIAVTELVLPDSLERIPEYAFAYNSSLNKIVLPRALTFVDNYAFYYCNYILGVYNKSAYTLPSSVELGDVLVVTDSATKANLEYFSLTTSSNEFLFVKTVDYGWYLYKINGVSEFIVLPKSFKVNGVTVESYKIRRDAKLQNNAKIIVDRSVTGINEYAFGRDLNVAIYYVGTAEEWNNLVAQNTIAGTVVVYYYSDNLYGNDGDTKWRYGDNGLPTHEATAADLREEGKGNA